jgi:hypothetical protein
LTVGKALGCWRSHSFLLCKPPSVSKGKGNKIGKNM